MNADVEKAVEALKWLAGHTDVRAIDHIVTLRQALRDQEAEIARLRKIEEERWAVVATRNAAVMRAEKAEALLREAYCHGYDFDIHERIRTFLGLSEND